MWHFVHTRFRGAAGPGPAAPAPTADSLGSGSLSRTPAPSRAPRSDRSFSRSSPLLSGPDAVPPPLPFARSRSVT